MNQPDDDTMRPDYDFSTAERGKHYRDFRRSTNLVFLERDVAAVFKDSEAVNEVLRNLAETARD